MDKPTWQTELRILLLEDMPTDAELTEETLREAGLLFTAKRVDNREAFIRELDEFKPDIVLADYQLPDFDGGSAVKIVRQQYPTVPVVMVTGAMKDEKAVELLKLGARDYVLKDRLARLGPAVLRALSEEQGIRARKAVEKALRASEVKFRTVVENTSDWLWEINEQGIYTYASPRVYDLLGYVPDEIVGKTPFDLMPTEEVARVSAIFSSIMAGKKSFQLLENTCLHKDGHAVILETSGIPVVDDNGIFRGYRGIDRDITERRQAEKKLHASEQKFIRFFMLMPIPLAVVSADGVITHANDRFTEILGYIHDDVPTLQEWWQLAYPDESYRRWVQDTWSAAVAKAAKEGADIEPIEYRVTCKSGAERIMLIGGAYIEGTLLATLIDITERKQAEAKFQRFFNLIPDLVCIASADGHFLKINPMWQKTLGYTEPEILSKTFLELIHPDDRAATMKEVERQLAGEATMQFINRYRCKDGSYRWLEWESTPAVDGNLLFASARDITERKQAESLLNEQLDELRRWQEATLGREMRTLELKHEVNELLAQAGQPPRYPSAEEPGSL